VCGFLPSCRQQRRLPEADRLLLSPEFHDLRKVHSRDQLLTALEMVCHELRRERGFRPVKASEIDPELLRSRLEEWLSRTSGEA
jgi:hypothetical protein